MSDLKEEPINPIDFPLTFEPFNAAINRTETSVTPPSGLRDINAYHRNLLNSTLFLNRSVAIKERQTITDPGWVISFTETNLIVGRLHNREDGEPYLKLVTWYASDKLTAEQKWLLFIKGPRAIKLGEANSENIEELENLLKAATDPEALLNMAAILNPEDLARLTSRVKIRTMGQENAIPRMDPKKIKELLIAAGLGKPEEHKGPEYGARIGPVNMRSGKTSTTIAIALCPCRKTQSRPLSRLEEYLDWPKRRNIQANLVREAQEVWAAKARPIILAAGWREVHAKYQGDVLYFTLADQEMWSSFGEDATQFLGGTLSKSSSF